MFNFIEKVDVSGFTIIIPSVSIGNIPQLTIDLLITTYNFKKVARIWHPAIIPCVGGDPYKSDEFEISTECEFYVNQDLKVALLQIRSTIETRLALKWFKSITESISQLQIAKIIILASAFDYDLHIVSKDKFYYLSNEVIQDRMSQINVKPIEVTTNAKPKVYGAGYAVKLFETMTNNKLSCTLIVKYASEGDNRPDAIMMKDLLKTFIGFSSQVNSIVYPSSWDFIFGGPPPVGLY